MTKSMSPKDAYEALKNGEAILIDVREADEFSAQHISFAQSLPLGLLNGGLIDLHFPKGKKIIVQCLGGKRGENACAILNTKGLENEIFNIAGGINAWQSAGLPVIGASQTKFSIFRQVQMIVGTLIAALVILGFLGLTFAFALAGIFALALALAGLTGWCGLALLLRKMPWNKTV